jgi:tRNA (uracil-5-)-methyltransferase
MSALARRAAPTAPARHGPGASRRRGPVPRRGRRVGTAAADDALDHPPDPACDERLARKVRRVARLFGGPGADAGVPNRLAACARGVEVHASPRPSGYRLRCRFAVVEEPVVEEGARVDPSDPESGARTPRTRLRYALFERGEVRVLDHDALETDFPAAAPAVARAARRVLANLDERHRRAHRRRAAAGTSDDVSGKTRRDPLLDPLLAGGVDAVGFLSNRAGDVVCTIWNGVRDLEGRRANASVGSSNGSSIADERAVDPGSDDWASAANDLRSACALAGVASRRRKSPTRVAGDDFVWETVDLAANPSNDSSTEPNVDGTAATRPTLGPRFVRYLQPEGSFSNPNGDVAERTARWLLDALTDVERRAFGAGERRGVGVPRASDPPSGTRAKGETNERAPSGRKLPSLVELYCGNGNHSCALASRFERVTAVEIDARLVDAARANFAENGLADVCEVARSDAALWARRAEEDAEATDSNAGGENKTRRFADRGVVLVDPPRAGLDARTRRVVRTFRSVLYVACDARSLARDLNEAPGGLGETHDVRRLAVFDHFPDSETFVEVVAWMERRSAEDDEGVPSAGDAGGA